MISDLQKASMWKRISAWLFDLILLSVIVVGIACILSAVTGYDGYLDTLDAAYAKYEAAYGIVFDVTEEQYHAMTEQELNSYNEAYAALTADPEAIFVYNMIINLTLVIVSLSILLGCLIWEFAVPLFLGNGQTLGKKIFAIGLMRTDGIRVTPIFLFIRTVLGKYTVGTMIPVLILIMLFFNMVGMEGTALLLILFLGQIIAMAVTRTNSAIHDLLAGTVVVDMASQRIFHSREELIAYTKRIHAERTQRRDY